MLGTAQSKRTLEAVSTLIQQIGGNPMTASPLLAHAVLMAYSSAFPACGVSYWYRRMTDEELWLFSHDWKR